MEWKSWMSWIMLITMTLTTIQGTEANPANPQYATNFSGMVVFANLTGGQVLARMWNNTGFNATTINITTGTSTDIHRFIETDYSTVLDVGAFCTTSSNSDAFFTYLNTTTGVPIYNITLTQTLSTANGQGCRLLFWNGTSEGIVFYETSNAANSNFGLRHFNSTSIDSSETVINYTTNYLSGTNLFFYTSERIGYNSTIITFMIDAGSDAPGIIHYAMNRTVIFNWTGNIGVNSTRGSGIPLNGAWTADYSKFILITFNNTATNDPYLFLTYNATVNTITQPSQLDNGQLTGVKDDFSTCTLGNRTDAIGYIGQDAGADVEVLIIFHNQTRALGYPTEDATTQRDTSVIQNNVHCFNNPINNEVIFTFIDNGANVIDYVKYNVTSNTWGTANLGTGASSSGAITTGGGAINTVEWYPNIEPDGAIGCVGSSLNNTFCGVYWNGTEFDTSKSTNLTGNVWAAHGDSFGFMFRGNLSTGGTPPAGTCDCPVSGDWTISDGSICTLTTTCNIGTNKVYVNNGALHITTGTLITDSVTWKQNSGKITYKQTTGKIIWT